MLPRGNLWQQTSIFSLWYPCTCPCQVCSGVSVNNFINPLCQRELYSNEVVRMNKFCKHKTQPIHINTDIISTFAGTNTQPIRLPAQENTYVKISISVITGLQSWRYWTSPWNKKNDKLIKYNTYKRFLLENTGYITNVPQRPCTCCHRFEQATLDGIL